VKGEDSIAGLVAACHRALDELHRLDTAKSIGGGKARGEGLLYRWRSAEEPRCYLGTDLGRRIGIDLPPSPPRALRQPRRPSAADHATNLR